MKYISILRGINVSGKNVIKMDDLKALYESLGFENVQTYIQSGNVIFDSPPHPGAEVAKLIRETIAEKYNYQVPVQIRTHREISEIIANCPYGPVNPATDGTIVLVTFLSGKPSDIKIAQIQKFVNVPEKLVVRGTEVYIYCPDGYGKSKLSNNFLEQKFEMEATTRNWKTVLKLKEMSE
ncbi:MAG: DUF1697 domain-containing protein [Calditrichales bacterium]|nr:MAG: DUF1697 domain-containing protein [Calditrichales bacterium]